LHHYRGRNIFYRGRASCKFEMGNSTPQGTEASRVKLLVQAKARREETIKDHG
jgi:hypothetical protein